jgi:hypothetical protein
MGPGDFWKNIQKGGPEECWPWLKCCSKQGYGRVSFLGKYSNVHRISWELTYGPIPPGLSVLHDCDNPPCCNPGHLFLGTFKDNMDDKIKKGRSRGKSHKGEDHPMVKLNDKVVRGIKIKLQHYYRGLAQELADEFGVSLATIKSIKANIIWRHINVETS